MSAQPSNGPASPQGTSQNTSQGTSRGTSRGTAPSWPATKVDEAEVALRSLVAEGREAGEERLPPEKALAAQLGTSLHTLREALSRLEAEHEIERRKRLGTLITPPGGQRGRGRTAPLAYPVTMMLSLPEYLEASGIEHHVQEVTVRREAVDPQRAAALGLEAGEQVFVASRLYVVDDEPAALLEHWVPTILDDHDVRIESLTGGVTTFLRESEKIDLTHVQSTVSAEAAVGTVARDLRVGQGSPLLVMHAKLYSRGNAAVALGRLTFRPDVIALSVGASEDDDTVVDTTAPGKEAPR